MVNDYRWRKPIVRVERDKFKKKQELKENKLIKFKLKQKKIKCQQTL